LLGENAALALATRGEANKFAELEKLSQVGPSHRPETEANIDKGLLWPLNSSVETITGLIGNPSCFTLFI
jgi:hypothetical protein